jgi:hypothetical protein
LIDFDELFGTAEQEAPRSLLQILEEQSLKSNTRKLPPGNNLRASNFGGCLRGLLYKSRGYEEEIDLGTQLTFEQGHAIHHEIQKLLQEAGILLSMEQEIFPLPEVPGHYDGIIEYLGKSLLEVKTVGFGQFERLFRYGSRQVSNKYKIQAHLYMKALDLPKTVFLFVNKNRQCSDEFKKEFPEANQQLFEYILFFDEEFYQENVVNKMASYKQHLEDNTLPPRKKIGECDYCPFEAQCKTDHESEKVAKREQAKADKKSAAKDPRPKAPKKPKSKIDNDEALFEAIAKLIQPEEQDSLDKLFNDLGI